MKRKEHTIPKFFRAAQEADPTKLHLGWEPSSLDLYPTCIEKRKERVFQNSRETRSTIYYIMAPISNQN